MSDPASKDFSARPAFYAKLMDTLYETAQAHGYELCLHGSLQNDLDAVAVPWREEVSAPSVLAAAIMQTTGAERATSLTEKPHRRQAVIYELAPGYLIDLSIIKPYDDA